MKESDEFCNILLGNRYKFPRLTELHYRLFGQNINDHDAATHVRACKRCFFEMKKRAVLSFDTGNKIEKAEAETTPTDYDCEPQGAPSSEKMDNDSPVWEMEKDNFFIEFIKRLREILSF